MALVPYRPGDPARYGDDSAPTTVNPPSSDGDAIAGRTNAGANSYVSLDDADAYFADRLDTDAWDDPDNADKKAAALVTATRILEATTVQFFGDAADDEQVLSWPRQPVTDARAEDNEAGEREISAAEAESYNLLPAHLKYDQDADADWLIPERVKQAQYEQALHLLANEGLTLADAQPAQIALGELAITNPGRIDLVSGLASSLLEVYTPVRFQARSFFWGNDGRPLAATSITDSIRTTSVGDASTRR